MAVTHIHARPNLADPAVSVVIPVCNEADNVRPLALEIIAALGRSMPYEIVFIDDGSTDATAANVRSISAEFRQIRLLRHGTRSGQSAAISSGVRAARGDWIVTLDGDGQNDPADIPMLLDRLAQDRAGSIKMVSGHRVARRDTWLRRFSSRIANRVRAGMLGDGTPDTGCGLKVFHRATYLSVPAFKHMHRFLPALFQREGAQVVSIPVNHRPRTQGTSKYGLHNRLWVGIVDLLGMRWLMHRAQRTVVTEEDLR
jgi:dolichol-phosphate mannosyltransferase